MTTKTAFNPDGTERATFEVLWTGTYPNLCRGEWRIKRNGINVSRFIPKSKRHSPMNTYGTYWVWSFGPHYEEEWTDYTDGEDFLAWTASNYRWIRKICHGGAEARALYEAIQAEDWRHESCGGCI